MSKELRVGSIIRDNDPRVGIRRLMIRQTDGLGHVRCWEINRNGAPYTRPKNGHRIRIDRIHTDGKPRKSGFTLEQ